MSLRNLLRGDRGKMKSLQFLLCELRLGHIFSLGPQAAEMAASDALKTPRFLSLSLDGGFRT